MPSRKHTHKYFYGKTVANDKVWSCALPGCTHYMPKHMEDMVHGRYSLCWNCESKFILDAQNMEKNQPECDDCSNPAFQVMKELETDRQINDPFGTRARREREERERQIEAEKENNEPKQDTICPDCRGKKHPLSPYCPQCTINRTMNK